MANFVVTFPLKTEIYQEHILDKRFEIGRKMYNDFLNVVQKRYKEMVKTKKYRGLFEQLTGDKSADKPVWKEIDAIRKEWGFTEYGFYKFMPQFQHYFKKNIDSRTAYKIASQVWKAYDKLFYGNGKSVHFKRYGEFNSLEGSENKSGIRFVDNHIIWNGLKIPVMIDYDNPYEAEAMQSPICFNRIIRKYVKNKYRYYVQIVFKGVPPTKINKTNGNVKHTIGKGDVGLDIGVSTIAISSENNVNIFELADKVQNIENQKRKLLRKMDRSRRATNPDNYNADGTIRKHGNKKMIWVKSNNYLECQHQLKELYRKQTEIRKLQHECLANYIISLGDVFYVEKMNFAGLQKKAKNTEINDSGKYKNKKRFGKSIANRAPSMLLSIINRKLNKFNNKLIEIDTYSARASQFNHFDETYAKKKLSQRWNDFNGIKVQRDLYSAFLIMNVDNTLKSFDLDKCNQRFNRFYELHNKEVDRLSGRNNLSCIAIK